MMGVIEEVQSLRSQGRTDDEIAMILQKRGANTHEVYSALSQANIKAAVNEDIDATPRPSQTNQSMTQEANGMEPSLINSPQQPAYEQQGYQQPEYSQAGYQPQYPQYQEQAQYQDASAGMSSDTISEIAEQVASEKLGNIKNQLEKVIDFRTSVESKMSYIDERLKRIEKIIDTLQSSILKKVGEYGTNIEDIKHELIETQKSFKATHHAAHHHSK